MKSILIIITMIFFVSCTNAPQKHKSFVHINPTPENHPWWLRIEYFPSGKNISNIPIKKINRDWCAANVFSPEDYASVLSNEDFDALKNRAEMAFELNGRFDGVHDLKAVSGVYQKCTGEKGNFIALIEPALPQKNDQAELISVLEMNQNKANFMVLLPEVDNMLGVGWCFDCDDLGMLKWDPSTNNLKWEEFEY